VTALARPSSKCIDKLQTHPLVIEVAAKDDNRQCLKMFSKGHENNWSRDPNGGLIPGQTGRLIVGLKRFQQLAD
jgi:hypothetical protein